MIYNTQNILSLQLRQSVNLRRLTRTEFFNRLQLIQTIEPLTAKAFEIAEEKILRDQSDDSPHGEPWHVTFHGSQFPGDDPMACPRQSLYRMMDFPDPAPMPRHLRQTADSGKAFETTLVETWALADMLLSSADSEKQTGFEFPEAWLTSSVDAVVRLPTGKPAPVEVKERNAKVLQEMKLGRGPFSDHVKQVKVQIAFVRMFQQSGSWLKDLPLCDHGYIYYGSRDWPLDVAEYRIDYDEKFFDEGIKKLMAWRAMFEEDLLPELNPQRRGSKFGHPHGWRWSYPPCQYCSFKKTCQLDFQEGNTQLSNSNGVNRARLIREGYDPEAARKRVRERWEKKKNEQKEEVQSGV